MFGLHDREGKLTDMRPPRHPKRSPGRVVACSWTAHARLDSAESLQSPDVTAGHNSKRVCGDT